MLDGIDGVEKIFQGPIGIRLGLTRNEDFVGAGQGGMPYFLQESSPCRNTAALTGDTPSNDFEGDAREDTPDIGADEVPMTIQ